MAENSGKPENVLHGMKAIADYYRKSEATLLALQKKFGFPIRKGPGGWCADKALIDEWHRDYVDGRTEKWVKRLEQEEARAESPADPQREKKQQKPQAA